jgi:lipopolysaccharide/colanic/teichoic acid biosynthesis glycosyltransferase
MSVVGPRPTIPEQVVNYDSFQRRRLAVAPGLTGWAQVNGNVSLSWEERILLDVWYVDHASMWLDVKILLKTVAVVIFGERPDTSALERARDHARRPARRSR